MAKPPSIIFGELEADAAGFADGDLTAQGLDAIDRRLASSIVKGYQLKPGQVDCSRDWAVVTKTTV